VGGTGGLFTGGSAFNSNKPTDTTEPKQEGNKLFGPTVSSTNVGGLFGTNKPGETTSSVPSFNIPGGVLTNAKPVTITNEKLNTTNDKPLLIGAKDDKKEGASLFTNIPGQVTFGETSKTTDTNKPITGSSMTGQGLFGPTGTTVTNIGTTTGTGTTGGPSLQTTGAPGETKKEMFPSVTSSEGAKDIKSSVFQPKTDMVEKKGIFLLTLGEVKAVKDLSGASKQEAPLLEPNKLPEVQQKLEDQHINLLMSKNIDDVINHWKNELDKTVNKFEDQTDKLKNFEVIFQKNFETVKLNIYI
jgi:hypothetical protein